MSTQAGTSEIGAMIVQLTEVMSEIISIVERETALVRAGRLNEAAALEPAKTELARRYVTLASQMKDTPQLRALAPETRAELRRRHDAFQALLQINLTVLATAHAVSESIMRGVSSELARKAAPQTYGASGRHSAPDPRAAQPLAVSRVL